MKQVYGEYSDGKPFHNETEYQIIPVKLKQNKVSKSTKIASAELT